MRAHLNIADVDSDTLLRYRLWKEQGGKCVYTGENIVITQVIPADDSVQADHIQPWSRFSDDSFNNKTLCLARANQRKKGQTPGEWFTRDASPDAWVVYTQRVETNHNLRACNACSALRRKPSAWDQIRWSCCDFGAAERAEITAFPVGYREGNLPWANR